MEAMTLGVIAVVLLLGGLLAGMIAYSKNRTTGTFVAFFILGALFPLLGIVIAALTKGPDVAPAAWHPDPYRQADLRWWDGNAWTSHTA
jgi:uncharacterized protein DUF2510